MWNVLYQLCHYIVCLFGVLGSIFRDGVRSTEGLFGSNTCEGKSKEMGLGRASH